jgi:hypothetical protein
MWKSISSKYAGDTVILMWDTESGEENRSGTPAIVQ